MKRVKTILTFENDGSDIRYLMTKSFRVRNNYTLAEALKAKSSAQGRLHVLLVPWQETSSRQQAFFKRVTKDLDQVLQTLVDRVDWLEEDLDVFSYLDHCDTIYIDKPYLKEDKAFFDKVRSWAEAHHVSLYEVDSNVFQATEAVSSKEEYSARTIRNKLWRLFLEPLVLMGDIASCGEREAEDKLMSFIENNLAHYGDRNDPADNHLSGLSPYLKYGLISPNVIYQKVQETSFPAKDAFLEELIVRRELAYNFVLYNPGYDRFDGITYPWAYLTMDSHQNDPRTYLYTKDDYIHFRTHDPYFNAAMKEMVQLGRMHSYMRMYWCKKIIEWSPTYEEAYQTAIELNNHYFLDGNTPNGYAGVAWCFGKHDRAWTERPIFGKLRYMNANGLKRKFAIDDYVKRIEKEIKESELQ